MLSGLPSQRDLLRTCGHSVSSVAAMRVTISSQRDQNMNWYYSHAVEMVAGHKIYDHGGPLWSLGAGFAIVISPELSSSAQG